MNAKEFNRWINKCGAEMSILSVDTIGQGHLQDVVISITINDLDFLINIGYDDLCEYADEFYPNRKQVDICDYETESWHGEPTAYILQVVDYTELSEHFIERLTPDLR